MIEIGKKKMKYLNTYKLFESNKKKIISDLESDLIDISYPLTDEGYFASVSTGDLGQTLTYVVVGKHNRPLSLHKDSLIECLQGIYDYLKSINYKDEIIVAYYLKNNVISREHLSTDCEILELIEKLNNNEIESLYHLRIVINLSII